jgi:hypothetical protein
MYCVLVYFKSYDKRGTTPFLESFRTNTKKGRLGWIGKENPFIAI